MASQGPAVFSDSVVFKGDSKITSIQGRINETFEEDE